MWCSRSLGGSGGSGPNCSSSMNELKFGEKIYLEEMGSSQTSFTSSSFKPPSSSFPSSPPSEAPGGGSPSAKRGRGAAQGGGAQQPPRCVVEGCGEDLTGAKSYYCRHKVCGSHSKSLKVIVAGIEQRFCQQCSRFHQLAEFDQGKRSCRRRLARHNERRRKPQPESFSSRYGQLPSSFHEDNGGRQSFVMDFSCSKVHEHERELFASTGAGVVAVLSNQWPGGQLDICPSGRTMEQVITPYSQGSNSRTLFSTHEVPPNECLSVSNSSSALSLLSSQQWGTTSSSDRAISISTSNYVGVPMAQPSDTTSFMGNPFTSNRHEMNTISASEMSRSVGFGQQMEFGLGHLSCEPELCPPSNQQCIEHGHGSAYGPANNQIHWPH